MAEYEKAHMWAISGTRGSSGLGSVSNEQMESSTCRDTNGQEATPKVTQQGISTHTHKIECAAVSFSCQHLCVIFTALQVKDGSSQACPTPC